MISTRSSLFNNYLYFPIFSNLAGAGNSYQVGISKKRRRRSENSELYVIIVVVQTGLMQAYMQPQIILFEFCQSCFMIFSGAAGLLIHDASNTTL